MGINNLTNSNRARHTKFFQGVIDHIGLKYKLLTRLGSRRSLDGIVFDIGKGRVLKFIFIGRGAVNDIKQVKKEYKVAKIMSDTGLGPKVYGFHEFTVPNLLNMRNTIPSSWPISNNVKDRVKNMYLKNFGFAIKNNRLAHIGTQRAHTFNLFQNWYNNINSGYNKVTKGVAIEMENLFSGPDVKDCMDLWTYVHVKKNPFPTAQYKQLVQKMHALGVAHGNMHQGNTMVQIKKNGSIRLVMIDFGRSVLKGNQYFTNVVRNNNFRVPMSKPPSRLSLTQFLKPVSYGLHKAASGGYRIAGKRGPIKPTKLTLRQLMNYANAQGLLLPAKITKKQIMNMIYKAKGGKVVSVRPVSGSLGLRFANGSVRVKGKRGGMIKPTLTVAQLKAYAAKKGINLMGAKLKKDILRRLAK